MTKIRLSDYFYLSKRYIIVAYRRWRERQQRSWKWKDFLKDTQDKYEISKNLKHMSDNIEVKILK